MFKMSLSTNLEHFISLLYIVHLVNLNLYSTTAKLSLNNDFYIGASMYFLMSFIKNAIN